MSKPTTLRLLAEVLAGLQVPHSIGGGNLIGAAAAPWRTLRTKDHLNLHGWTTVDEYEEALGQILTEHEVPE